MIGSNIGQPQKVKKNVQRGRQDPQLTDPSDSTTVSDPVANHNLRE